MKLPPLPRSSLEHRILHNAGLTDAQIGGLQQRFNRDASVQSVRGYMRSRGVSRARQTRVLHLHAERGRAYQELLRIAGESKARIAGHEGGYRFSKPFDRTASDRWLWDATEDQLRRIVRYNVPELLALAHVAGSRKLAKSPFWYHSD